MASTRPLSIYSPSPQAEELFSKKMAAGRLRMRESRVVICGLARDIEDVFSETASAIERLGAAFSDYQVVLFENDSTDQTQQLLLDWSLHNGCVTLLSEDLGDPVNRSIRCLQRAARMAAYRNRYLDHIAEQYSDYDYTIVLDTDLGSGWNEDGVASTFGYMNWDFVGSYGILQRHDGRRYVPIHYDAWAFRVLGDDTPMKTKVVNELKPEFDGRLTPVNSCFGGLGIYRMPALLSARYSGEDCEHVTFHRRMRAAGYDRLFLNSWQTTHYGWREAKPWRVWRGLRERLMAIGGIPKKRVA